MRLLCSTTPRILFVVGGVVFVVGGFESSTAAMYVGSVVPLSTTEAYATIGWSEV